MNAVTTFFNWLTNSEAKAKTPAPQLPFKKLHYLIGADPEDIEADEDSITVVPFDCPPLAKGLSVGYCNLLEEPSRRGRYGPYLKDNDTARAYSERVIDPKGPGWIKNLLEQCSRRAHEGFKYIELDNADAYRLDYVLEALSFARIHGLQVLAKNPKDVDYLRHPAVCGVIVEEDCGAPAFHEHLRTKAGRPDLPVWFVSFNGTTPLKLFHNMGSSVSPQGEYETSKVLVP